QRRDEPYRKRRSKTFAACEPFGLSPCGADKRSKISALREPSLLAGCVEASRSVWSATSLLALSYGIWRFESGSKLHALQTLRKGVCDVIGARTFLSAAPSKGSGTIVFSEGLERPLARQP